MRFFFLVLIFLASPSRSQAQNLDHQGIVWTGYFFSLDISKKWFWNAELQERFFMQPARQFQGLFRTGIFYRFSDQCNTGSTFAFFLNSPGSPTAASHLLVPEFRSHQELNVQYKLNDKFSFVQRYMLEGRLLHKSQGDALVPGWNFYLRFRYRFGIDFQLFTNKKQTLKLRLSDEFILTTQPPHVFDQNRLYLGLHCQINPVFSIETGYLHLFQQKKELAHFYDRHIWRISIFTKIGSLKN